MLMEIGFWGFARLAFALLLFAGPGLALFSFHPDRDRADRTQSVVMVFVFAAAFWIVLMPLLLAAGVRLSPFSAGGIAAAGWALGVGRLALRKPLSWSHNTGPLLPRLLLLAAAAWVLAAGVYVLRADVVGSGSDSYHHSLFTQMLMDQGRLPVDYSPYTDQVITFTYHFGFHVVSAVMAWFSGLPAHQVVLVMAPLLVALSTLAAAFLAESVTGSRAAGLAAGLVVGVLGVFPSYMLTWGRYPQVAGLVMLCVWLALFRDALLLPVDGRRDYLLRGAYLGFLGAAVGGMHYRVALMALLSAAALLFSMALTGALRRERLPSRLLSLVLAGAAACALFLPWAAHVFLSLRQGYAVTATVSGSEFYSFRRLGAFVLQYPTNLPLLALGAAAALWGLLERDWRMLWLSIWVGAGFLIALSRISGVFMDPVSMLISLYLPVSAAVGWLAARLERQSAVNGGKPRALRWVVILACAAFVIGFAPMGARNLAAGKPYVQPDDLPAIAWVRENTPDDALFMVNLFHFNYSTEQIIASDAGYWLPLLAGRRTVSLPMPFLSERFRSAETIDGLKRLDALNGKLCSPQAASALRDQGVTHVYLGSAGGRISARELLDCPFFKAAFHHEKAYVFRFLPEAAAAP